MVSKQDKQAARTAADLERRYGLGKDEAEYADMSVTRLHGRSISADTIRANDSPMHVDLSNRKFAFDLIEDSGSEINKKAEMSKQGLIFYGLGPSGVLESKKWYPALTIQSAYMLHTESEHINVIHAYASDLFIGAEPGPSTGHLAGYPGRLIIGYPAVSLGNVIIEGKRVSWKDNGDGTYSLIGTDFEW